MKTRKPAVALVACLIAWMSWGQTIASEFDLPPIESIPEPLGELHPKVRWMVEEKIRYILF